MHMSTYIDHECLIQIYNKSVYLPKIQVSIFMCFHFSKLSFELFKTVMIFIPNNQVFLLCHSTPVMLSLCAVKSQCSESVE